MDKTESKRKDRSVPFEQNVLKLTHNLTLLADDVFKANAEKGFHDQERTIDRDLMLIIGEISEGHESIRKGDHRNEQTPLEWMEVLDKISQAYDPDDTDTFKAMFESSVKDTFNDELADAVIRILDTCGKRGIDIHRHVQYKLLYNRTRAHKHGKKF